MTYNPWPIGQLPKALQRREPEMIRAKGYQWTDAREIITMFENKVAEFSGCKYAVAVDCCTHAIELCFRYGIYQGFLVPGEQTEVEGATVIQIPLHTYVSAAIVPMRLGFTVQFINSKWSGLYQFGGTKILDGAVRWRKGMYYGFHALQCLSFQIKKRIPIGRGGMVLTDDKEAADWIRLASYDGRDLNTPYDHPDHIKFQGYHYYMTPEDAARGILLMDSILVEGDSASWENYPNVKTMLKL